MTVFTIFIALCKSHWHKCDSISHIATWPRRETQFHLFSGRLISATSRCAVCKCSSPRLTTWWDYCCRPQRRKIQSHSALLWWQHHSLFQENLLLEAEKGEVQRLVQRINQEDLQHRMKNHYSLLIGPTVDGVRDLIVNLQSCLEDHGIEHVYTDEYISKMFPKIGAEFEHIVDTITSSSTVVIVYICESLASFKSWMYNPVVTQVMMGQHAQKRIIPVTVAGFRQLPTPLKSEKLKQLSVFPQRGSWRNTGRASSTNIALAETANQIMSAFSDIRADDISDQLTGRRTPAEV